MRAGARWRGRARGEPAALPEVTISESDGVRYLHLGSPWVQGAMRIGKPLVVELAYVQRMLAALLWLPTAQLGSGRAVQLGLGAGALTRFTTKALGMPTTVVEINRQVVEINARWFRLPRETEVVLGDAAHWLARAEPGSVALLHADLYDEHAAAPVLDDEAFYAACRRVLVQTGGLFSVNLFGRDASFSRSIERVAQAFGADQVWSLSPTREGNTIVVAGRGVVVPGREELAERAREIEARYGSFGLPARKWLRMVRPYVPAQPRALLSRARAGVTAD